MSIIRSYFSRPEVVFDDLGNMVARATKFELAIFKHAEKILAVTVIGAGVIGFFAVKYIISPAIEKVVNPHFKERRKTITRGVLCLGAGAAAFKLFTMARNFSKMDVMPPGF